jgi:hypothetical protein
MFVWCSPAAARASLWKRLPQDARRIVQVLGELALQADVAPGGTQVTPRQVHQFRGQDLPEPVHQLRLARAAELGEGALGGQERFLDQVRGIGLAAQPPADLHPGQEPQVVPIQLEELSQRLLVSRLRGPEQLHGIRRYGCTH